LGKKVLVLMGTRPEAIKLAPVIQALDAEPALMPVVVSTGQHREMLAQVVKLFSLQVDHELDVMRPNQTLAGLTARLITAVDRVLENEKPALVLVQGDTTTVLASALACHYRHVPLGHVEAGLRTGDLTAPFPEEANRVLTSRLATLHFAPTSVGEGNLLSEGIEPARIFVTGNTVIDALQMEVERQRDAAARSAIDAYFDANIGPGWRARRIVLVTGHRRESFGGGFGEICDALVRLAEAQLETLFVYPVHLNPNVRGPVYERLSNITNIKLLEPQPYDRFVALLSACHLVLTDSGGVQEEAPGLGKPVLVMRDITERPEGVDAGAVRLVGADASHIFELTQLLLTDNTEYAAMARAVNPYGDGKAGPRIARIVSDHLKAATDEG
jgi:UDP-N-acetylglucosamine 2-epimerase (non-hydrolysing)